MIYVSSSLTDYVIEAGIIPVHKTCSDHGIPYVIIKGYGIPSRGPGLWKLNNQLLLDTEYVAQMNNNISEWFTEAESDLPDLGTQWGFIKHKAGEFSRSYGAKLKKARALLKINIENQLKQISENLSDENLSQYQELKDKLDEIIEYEVKGSILRSLCDDYEKGEKCTKYFFSLEKFRAKQKTILRLKLQNGSFTSDQKTILNACRTFY